MRVIADQSRTNGNSNTKEILKTAEEKIDATISKKISALTNQVQKNNVKDFFKITVLSLVLLLLGSGATLFVLNYRSGTQIAEQKAEQALKDRESAIAEQAIADYKASKQFVIDSATYVANNWKTWTVAETMYQEMPIKDKKDFGLYDWLNDVHQQYKKR